MALGAEAAVLSGMTRGLGVTPVVASEAKWQLEAWVVEPRCEVVILYDQALAQHRFLGAFVCHVDNEGGCLQDESILPWFN